ncbi:MAG: pilus assembly protein [Gammaproteobacteria bacterium]|nr:MAG: pilus assembly protein [Gammaproteobacteria bacterium]
MAQPQRHPPAPGDQQPGADAAICRSRRPHEPERPQAAGGTAPAGHAAVRRNSTQWESGRGQAMVEFVIILPVLMLLVAGILQFALIYHAKITLNYAAFEVARAGSLNNAKMEPMQKAFVRSMAALHTHREGVPALNAAKQKLRDEIASGYVQIRLINPAPASFTDHGVTVGNEVHIPNDNLMYRDAGSTGLSGQSVQDANLIKVHVGYCYELLVPFVNGILVRMMSLAPTALQPENIGPPDSGSFAESCVLSPADADRKGFPIFAQAILRMQSDPIQESAVTP